MTPKERVFAKLSGKPVDKVPNFNILMAFAARFIGRKMDEFCRDYRVLVEGNLKAAETFGIDILSTMSDAYRETADFGAAIKFPYDTLPTVEHFIKAPEDIQKLKPFRIENSTRMLDRLHAIELYKKEAGNHWPILGWVEGCAAESSDLMGLSELVFAIYDEPAMVREMFDICFETARNCIEPQIKAGADIIGVGDAVASVLGPEIYREWILPYERKIFEEIRRHGAVGRLHTCGNIAPLLDDVVSCGADIIDIDWMVDFALAKEKLAEKVLICGNFDPVSVLMNGTPGQIGEAVDHCLDAGGDRCIIMAGCEVPADTPHTNLLTVHEALMRRAKLDLVDHC